MYAKVIPITKLPRQIGIFDYLIPQKLKEKIIIGQLVEINFRNQLLDGIIISIHKKSSIAKLKKILRLKDNKPFLNHNLLSLINWASFYYCVSPSALAKIIIPNLLKQKKEQLDIFKTTPIKSLGIKKTDISNIKKILNKIEKTEKVLLHWNNYKNKIAIYIKLLDI
ncbi:hypothetical protein ACFL2L_01065 [Patescibacteria group bacterium]